MMEGMAAYIRALIRHRRIVVAAIVLLAGVAAWSARRIRIRFDFRDLYYYAGNPRIPTLESYYRYFDDPGGYVAVLVEADDVFRPDVIAYVDQVTQALSPEPIFARVRSLTTLRIPRA